jgi:hypothetical protein
MTKSVVLLSLLAVLVTMGCVSQSQFLDQYQDAAVQAALGRGRFEMNCPDATGTVISRDVIQPAFQGPWVGGIQRAEYTVGLAGCGKRTTVVVVCPQGGSGCFSTAPGGFHPQW